MREVLLQELSNSDINWILANGHQEEVVIGKSLVEPGIINGKFYIILEGTFISTISQNLNNPLTRAFAALDAEENPTLEIMRFSSGEVIGEKILITTSGITTTTKALEKSLVIAIPVQTLELKLKQDAGFAGRFYRAVAILYSDRLQSLLNRLSSSKTVPIQPVKDVLFIFGQLHDSDLSWLATNGITQRISRQATLICQGGPVDALYLLLQGKMAILVSPEQDNPLTRIFSTLEGNQSSEQELARLYKGGIVGESAFVDGRLPYATVKALEDSLVLGIPRSKLIAKLQQDVGFASRFYQAIATLLANKLQVLMNRMGYGRRVYNQGFTLDEKIIYDDEIDSKSLDKISIAAVKFDWMVDTLKVV